MESLHGARNPNSVPSCDPPDDAKSRRPRHGCHRTFRSMRNEATIACGISARANSCAKSHNKTAVAQQREKWSLVIPEGPAAAPCFDKLCKNPPKSKENGARGLWSRISCGTGFSRFWWPSPLLMTPKLPGHGRFTLQCDDGPISFFLSHCVSSEFGFYSNTTKIPRKDPQEREERKTIAAGEGKKKREILGLPTLRGPTLV